MPENNPTLTVAASAVEALGASQAEIDSLDDATLQHGMRMIATLDLEAQRYKLWLAASITRRSHHTLGYQGLARKNGFPTPATFIQSMTGTSIDEATKLARLGEMAVQAELVSDAGPDSGPAAGPDGSAGSGGSALTTAATSGGLTLDCADAIRRGLGKPDAAITDSQLRVEAEKLIAHAQQASLFGAITPEALLKLARHTRGRLDAAAIERGEKHRSASRYVRVWQRDGLSGGSWCLPDEDGGLEIHTALKLLLAATHGGPRFPDTDKHGHPIQKTTAETALDETRTAEQILADGFTQISHNGITADPTVIPGAGRAAVRVIVNEAVLVEKATTGTVVPGPDKTALLEASLTPITFTKLDEYLCEGGTVTVGFNHNGTIDVGREQRLFTQRQRTALGVRDGGCRFPGCNKPPSWCEAHHILQWAHHNGRTDTINGILLCRYHHMFIHNSGWDITRTSTSTSTTYWLTPPETIDPQRTPIEMPTKDPLVAAIAHAHNAYPHNTS